jgi:hypothetical protein
MQTPRHNLTLVLDEELLLAARKLALERRTSVNQLVRDYLTGLVASESRKQAARESLKKMMEKGLYEVGEITWTREDLYDRKSE